MAAADRFGSWCCLGHVTQKTSKAEQFSKFKCYSVFLVFVKEALIWLAACNNRTDDGNLSFLVL